MLKAKSRLINHIGQSMVLAILRSKVQSPKCINAIIVKVLFFKGTSIWFKTESFEWSISFSNGLLKITNNKIIRLTEVTMVGKNVIFR